MTDMQHKFVKMLGEFDKLRVYTMESTVYSGMGLTAISTYLRDSGYNIDSIPVGFMPYIDTASGKIATRISKYILAATGQKLTPENKQEVGNIANKFISRENDTLFDFHDGVLDWPTGNFGNDNSCWRKSYKASTPMLAEGSGYGGGFAMRLFSPERKKGRGLFYGGIGGYGRLWLLPWKDSMLVFNPYGETIEWFVDRLVKIMSEGTNEELFVTTVNMKNDASGLYTNGATYIITAKKEYGKKGATTSMPVYITKVCRSCRLYYARTPEEEAGKEEGYCQDCGERCGLTGTIADKTGMIQISEPVTLLYKRKNVTLTGGFVLAKFADQFEYCVECGLYHGQKGLAKHG